MGLFDFFTSKRKTKATRREISARRQQAANAIAASYQEVANNDPSNIRHFSESERGSHAAIYTESLRKDLVDYARFEVANNPNLKGMVITKVNDVVGREPKIRFIPGDKPSETERKACHGLTKKITEWIKQIHLGKKIRTACNNKVVDGEGFIIAMKNIRRENLQLDFP